MIEILDPTVEQSTQPIKFVARPDSLSGLRVGLVENTKFNSEALLVKLGHRLSRDHGMTVAQVARKRSPSHGVTEEAVDALRRVCDFVVSGIGD